MTDPARLWIRRSAAVFCAAVWISAAVATHVPQELYAEVAASDGTLHFFGYLALGAVWILTLRLHGVRWRRRLALSLPVLLLYAALDELTQPLVGRCATLPDWSFNALGVLAAVAGDAVISLCRHLLRRHWKMVP